MVDITTTHSYRVTMHTLVNQQLISVKVIYTRTQDTVVKRLARRAQVLEKLLVIPVDHVMARVA